jgi:hypothetical protein
MNKKRLTLNEELTRMSSLFGYMNMPNRLIMEQGTGKTLIQGADGTSTAIVKTIGQEIATEIENSIVKAAKNNSEFLTKIGKTSSDLDWTSLKSLYPDLNGSVLTQKILDDLGSGAKSVYDQITEFALNSTTLKSKESLDASIKDIRKQIDDTINKPNVTKQELDLLRRNIDTTKESYPVYTDVFDTYSAIVNTKIKGMELPEKTVTVKTDDVTTTKTTVDVDPTKGGTLETKPKPEVTTNTNDLSAIEVYVPKYEWRFGGDLENHVGEFKSDWFNEDLIDFNKIGDYPDPIADKPVSYIEKLKDDVDDEFPESDYFQTMIKKMREGFSMIQHGNVRKDTWLYFPTGGFERYGIDNFREWIKKLYKDKRLKVKTYATDFWTDSELGFAAPKEEWKHSGPLDPTTETFFDFEVLPKSDKNLWKINLENPQKTPFEVEYTWKLDRIKNDTNLSEKEKSDEILKAFNEYQKHKKEARERNKYWYKFGMKKPEQDPDLNE